MAHLDPAALEAGLDEIRRSPQDRGTVELIVRRPAVEEREVLEEAEIDPVEGLVGDRGSANPDLQITLMNARVAALVADDPERRQLAGDQLYVDFDLSRANVPPGTRLDVGSATLEISEQPHTGCGKFAKRFGVDALKFVNSKVGRELNLRGVNARVVAGGRVRPGDRIGASSTK
jgi:MOSC domain-containing protein YiiM